MRVHIGADHAGFELKSHLLGWLEQRTYEVVDHGAESYDPEDDYPRFCLSVGEGVVADPGSVGIVLGGSGNGEQIAANKVDGVRAALAWSEETASLARQHNDANVVAVGARMHPTADSTRIVEVFLSTSFSGSQRHARRIEQLLEYERGRHA